MGSLFAKLKPKDLYVISIEKDVLPGYLNRMSAHLNNLKVENFYTNELEYTEMFKSRSIADKLCIQLKNIGYEAYGEYNSVLKMFSVTVCYTVL